MADEPRKYERREILHQLVKFPCSAVLLATVGPIESLASEEAKKVATEQGLGDPQTEEACLKCHTTQAFLGSEVAVSAKGKYEDAEGVGCESCHGPGSAYKSMKVMKDSNASLAAGLIVPDEATCRGCHEGAPHDQAAFDYQAAKTTGIHELTKSE